MMAHYQDTVICAYMCIPVYTHICLISNAVLAQTSGADTGSADPAWLGTCVRGPPDVQNTKICCAFFWS